MAGSSLGRKSQVVKTVAPESRSDGMCDLVIDAPRAELQLLSRHVTIERIANTPTVAPRLLASPGAVPGTCVPG